MRAMDSEAKYYFRDDDGSPVGPWTREQLREHRAAGRIHGRTLIEWRSLAQCVASGKPASGIPPMDSMARPVSAPEPEPFNLLTLDFILGLLFMIGAGIALYYALWFDPAQAEGDKAAALNQRLTGVICGGGLVVVIMLVKIYRVLKTIRR